jgi:hypothetical protein
MMGVFSSAAAATAAGDEFSAAFPTWETPASVGELQNPTIPTWFEADTTPDEFWTASGPPYPTYTMDAHSDTGIVNAEFRNPQWQGTTTLSRVNQDIMELLNQPGNVPSGVFYVRIVIKCRLNYYDGETNSGSNDGPMMG